jgi:hypothetical protein
MTVTVTETETVYRQQLRPVIEDAATAMNRIFPPPRRVSHSVSHSAPDRHLGHQTVLPGGRNWVRTSGPSLVRRAQSVAGHRLTCQLAEVIVARRRCASPEARLRLAPHLAPRIRLARLMKSLYSSKGPQSAGGRGTMRAVA